MSEGNRGENGKPAENMFLVDEGKLAEKNQSGGSLGSWIFVVPILILAAWPVLKLFQKANAIAPVAGNELSVSGDFGEILGSCLQDAETLFKNNGVTLQDRYGIEPRRVLYNWWTSLKSMQKALNKQERFADAKTVHTVITRAVECSYNYYQIEPEHITDRMGTVIFALVFYVVYTLWYGYAILFIFEGWGLQINH